MTEIEQLRKIAEVARDRLGEQGYRILEESVKLRQIEIRARALISAGMQKWAAAELKAVDLNFADRFYELQEEIAEYNSEKAKHALDAWERAQW